MSIEAGKTPFNPTYLRTNAPTLSILQPGKHSGTGLDSKLLACAHLILVSLSVQGSLHMSKIL